MMRIGQLARNLNVSPSEIIYLLQGQGFTLDSGTNARLDEAQIRLVVSKFAPEKVESLESYMSQEDESESPSEVKSEPAEPTLASGESNELPETIRAPKIELQGLKVLGKIDLPEPKKKQTELPAPQPVEQREDRPAFRRRDQQRSDRPWVNPLERQRQREAREAEEKKRRQAEQRKELRTAAYLNRQKKLQSRQRGKEKTTPVTEKPVVTRRPVKPKPTSFFGRIWHWLTNAE